MTIVVILFYGLLRIQSDDWQGIPELIVIIVWLVISIITYVRPNKNKELVVANPLEFEMPSMDPIEVQVEPPAGNVPLGIVLDWTAKTIAFGSSYIGEAVEASRASSGVSQATAKTIGFSAKLAGGVVSTTIGAIADNVLRHCVRCSTNMGWRGLVGFCCSN